MIAATSDFSHLPTDVNLSRRFDSTAHFDDPKLRNRCAERSWDDRSAVSCGLFSDRRIQWLNQTHEEPTMETTAVAVVASGNRRFGFSVQSSSAVFAAGAAVWLLRNRNQKNNRFALFYCYYFVSFEIFVNCQRFAIFHKNLNW